MDRPLTNGDKRNAYKDTLRQRQQSIRNKRASSTAPSDTLSRRSGYVGGSRSHYPPRDYDYHRPTGPSQPEHGISLRSLREEASNHHQQQQQQQHPHFNNHYQQSQHQDQYQQHQNQYQHQHQYQHHGSSSLQFDEPRTEGIIIHGARTPHAKEAPVAEFRTRRWEEAQTGQGAGDNHRPQEDKAAADMYDLRELLLAQRSSATSNKPSEDKGSGLGLSTKANASDSMPVKSQSTIMLSTSSKPAPPRQNTTLTLSTGKSTTGRPDQGQGNELSSARKGLLSGSNPSTPTSSTYASTSPSSSSTGIVVAEPLPLSRKFTDPKTWNAAAESGAIPTSSSSIKLTVYNGNGANSTAQSSSATSQSTPLSSLPSFQSSSSNAALTPASGFKPFKLTAANTPLPNGTVLATERQSQPSKDKDNGAPGSGASGASKGSPNQTPAATEGSSKQSSSSTSLRAVKEEASEPVLFRQAADSKMEGVRSTGGATYIESASASARRLQTDADAKQAQPASKRAKIGSDSVREEPTPMSRSNSNSSSQPSRSNRDPRIAKRLEQELETARERERLRVERDRNSEANEKQDSRQRTSSKATESFSSIGSSGKSKEYEGDRSSERSQASRSDRAEESGRDRDFDRRRLGDESRGSGADATQSYETAKDVNMQSDVIAKSLSADESPILFAAASRMHGKPDASKDGVSAMPKGPVEEAPILFSPANRQQPQHPPPQQQQSVMETDSDGTDSGPKDSPILFASARRLQQGLDSPILFSAASRTNAAQPTHPSAVFPVSSTASDLAMTKHNPTQPPMLGHLGPKPWGSPSQFFGGSGLNMVPTPHGEVGRSDMSLAFEIIDRCTVDLQQLQQRFVTLSTTLNEATTKALESDARLAQLGAQIELELEMSHVHHQLKNGIEQQQLPEVQKMMRASQEMISRLNLLSTTAAAGSATAVVMPYSTLTGMRLEPSSTAMSSNGSAGAEAGTGTGTGAGASGLQLQGQGSTGGFKGPVGSTPIASAAALALAKLAESGHSSASPAIKAETEKVLGSGNDSTSGNGTAMDVDSQGGHGGNSNSGTISMRRLTLAGQMSQGGQGVGQGSGQGQVTVLHRPCLSFNIAPKGCRFLANQTPCPYRHVCLYCGSSDHVVMECDYTSSEPSHDFE